MRLHPILVALVLAGCAGPGADDVARPEPLPTPQATAGGAAPPTTSPAPGGPPIRLERVEGSFTSPILVTHDGTPGRLYVVEQGGRVHRIENGARETWIDISADVRSGGEQGLLGLAFEPDSPRYYLSYSDRQGDTVVERVTVNIRERMLFVDQPYGNHNGGHLAFGPDGYLYVGLGDGGSAGDPQGNGQDPDALLGSLLRLDVSGATGYTIPNDNTWREAWSKGLRNPWRFSFDRESGDLYIADVGQHKLEEINHLPAGSPGANFGWNVFEGTARFSPIGTAFSEVTFPVAEYTHDDGCSVTGGHVYRGSAHPSLDGIYFLGDYCSGKIWGLRQMAGTWRLVELLDTDLNISSFGEDADGEIYVVNHKGDVHKLIATGAALPDALRG